MAIRAVVFDLDDTLVDHVGAVRDGFRSWFSSLAPSALAAEEAETLWFALEDRHYQRFVDGEVSFLGQRRDRLREFRHALGHLDPLVDDAVDELFGGYLAAYTRAWRAHSDAAPTLARVRSAGLAVAVLTNGWQPTQEAKLRGTGLLGAAGPVFASSALGAAKPSGAAYDAVASALGLDPTDLLMVGDNLVNDVEGARAAGWSAVHLDRTAETTNGSICTLAHLRW